MNESDEDPVVSYIRSIPIKRIEQAEEIMKVYDAGELLDLERYFNFALMETIYRAHKGSFKVASSKSRGQVFLALILHVLFGVPRMSPKFVFNRDIERKIRKVLDKRFENNSYFLRYSSRFLDAKTGKKTASGWVNVEPYIFSLVGAETFFYCTLKALIEICKKALSDTTFSFEGLISWQQGIVLYLLEEVVDEEKTMEQLEKERTISVFTRQLYSRRSKS